MKIKNLTMLLLTLALLCFANAQNCVVTVVADPVTGGVVIGGGTYTSGSEIDLIAVPNEGYHLQEWVAIDQVARHAGNTDTIHVTVDHDITYEAFFVESMTYTISVISANESMGSATGGGTFFEGDHKIIQAMPNSGYDFRCWQDGNTDNPRTIIVNGDMSYIAFFQSSGGHDTTSSPEYIHDTVYIHDTIYIPIYIHDTIYITLDGVIEAKGIDAKVYSSRGQIIVDGACGNTVTLFDISGRVLATKRDDYSLLRFDVPASGTYMIKIGQTSVHKIVVIR